MTDSDATAPASPSFLAKLQRDLRDLAVPLLSPPLVAAAAAASLLAFAVSGSLVDFPSAGPYDGLLLHDHLGVAVLLVAVVTLAIATLAGTAIAGRVRYDAGWGTALLGLLVLRARGGSVYHTLDGRGNGVFLTMLAELLVLSLAAAALWALLHTARERGATSPGLRRWLELPRAAARNADRPSTADPLAQKLGHLLVSTGVCGLVVMVACRNDDPMQTTLSVAAGGYLGALAAYGAVRVRPAPWSCAGPVLAGVVGYLVAFAATPELRLELGEPGGPLWPMALPLPLEWVGAGVPAALLGYVRSRTKQSSQARPTS